MVGRMGSLHSGYVEDFAEEEYGSLSKRSRFEAAPSNQVSSEKSGLMVPPSQYNPLDEPSPLGLKLRKSPSLLDLIQMRLSQGDSASISAARGEEVDSVRKKDVKANNVSNANDKLKASNFPASLLRIGTWEYVSKYEGDLVAKCYFAKHKLVWEVLEGGLKSKIEIQWSDITALKADLPDNAPGCLTIVLARKPVFFRETNPQPRKHTLWQASSDFTDGQATVNLQHYIECPAGVMNKHYEKLLQCDMRLSMLSQHPELVTNSPLLTSQSSAPENSEGSKGVGSNQMTSSAKESSTSVCQDTLLSPAQHVSKELASPCSVNDTLGIEGSSMNDEHIVGEQGSGEPSKLPGLRPSMSMSDLVNHIENCISGQMTSGSLSSDRASEYQHMLEDISHDLLSDTTCATGLDERSLMKKVNSLCCLLQDPALTSSAQVNGDNWPDVSAANCGKNVFIDLTNDAAHEKTSSIVQAPEGGNFYNSLDFKPASSMSRKDSFGDLLLHLPSIASLPRFPKLLSGIAEDDESWGVHR